MRVTLCSLATTAALVLGACGGGATEGETEQGAQAAVNREAAARPVAGEGDTLGSGARPSAAAGTVDPMSEYDAKCAAAQNPPPDCYVLERYVMARLVSELEEIERSRDQRSAESALAVLGLWDEPEVLIAAGRILGRFPDTPGIAEKVVPLIDSPYHEVQRMAAQVLSAGPDQNLASVGQQWNHNHSGSVIGDAFTELGFPAHYPGMGFPDYPGAERYTPADSDRSIGWWSPDPAATVAAKLGEEVGTAPIKFDDWMQRRSQTAMAAFPTPDPAKMEEMQKIMEQYMKNQDPKLAARLEVLQKEMVAPMEQASANAEKTMDNVAMPPGVAPTDQVYYLVAAEKDNRVSRLVLVFRQPGIERTVMQMSWDLRDYPSAWGEAR
jgi:hypothetical protein